MKKKKKKFKIAYKKSEKKGEFECSKNESLVFQKRCPNHAWTEKSKPSYIQSPFW